MRLDIVLDRAALVALACLIGLVINLTFRVPHGYWIVWTIMIIYSVFLPGAVYNRIGQRVAGTVAGLLIAFFVTQLIKLDYQLVYAFVVLIFLIVLLMTINYAYAVIFITILIVLISDIQNPVGGDQQIIVDRLVCTLIGAGIVLAIESCFYKYLQFYRKMLEQKIQQFCHNYSRHIDSLINFLQDRTRRYLPDTWIAAVQQTSSEIDSYLGDARLRNKKNKQTYENIQEWLHQFRTDMAKLSFLVQNFFGNSNMNETTREQFIHDLSLIQQELTQSDHPVKFTDLYASSVEPDIPQEHEAFQLLQNIYRYSRTIREYNVFG